MKVFEFKQIESGSNFRIEIDYHHYMQKQTAKNVIARHKEDEIPVFQSKGIGDYKMEDTVHESKDLDL